MLNERRIINLKILVMLVFSIVSISGVWADVVYLNDGSILFASFTSSSADEMVYTNSSGPISLKKSDVLRTEPNFSRLQGTEITLIFKDKTEMVGLFTDFDEDIGYFVELSFGTLTVPLDRVEKLLDPVQSKKFAGGDTSYSARALTYIPIGNDNFDLLLGAGLGAEFRVSAIRGLFVGVDVDVLGAQLGSLEDLSYLFIQITPKAEFRYLGFRTGSGFVSRFTPFASVGAGVTEIFIKDLRDSVSSNQYGAMSPHAKAEAGFEFKVTDTWSIALDGVFMSIFQKTEAFSAVGGTVSLGYEF